MASKVGMTFLDYSGEQGRLDFYMPTSSAGNIAGQLTAISPAQAGSVAEAICALSNCTCIVSDLQAVSNKYTATPPVSQFAQRELALCVTYQDTVTQKKYRMSIPGPAWATLGQENSDMINPEIQAWQDFITAFEAAAVSELGNPITVLSGRLVGRSK